MAGMYAEIEAEMDVVENPDVVAARRRFQLRNIVLVGVVFMLLSSASQTCSTVETIVIDSVHDQYFNGTSTMGYNLLAVLNGVIASSVWISQTVVSNIGPKNAMLVGGVCYFVFVSTFIRPLAGTLYGGAVILGIGQAMLWTAEGSFLSLNSDKETIGRHSTIFWALYQTSLLWGNLFFFYEMHGQDTIADETRYWIFGSLMVLAAAGVLVILTLKYPLPKELLNPRATIQSDGNQTGVKSRTFLQSIGSSFRLLRTRPIWMMMSTFMYIALEQTFWSNVYQSSLGYTKQFGPGVSESLVGLSGVCVGCGEILGSFVYGLVDKRFPRLGRDPVVVSGYLLHMIAFFLVFVNIPNDAPLGDTFSEAIIHPNYSLALLCSVLLGFGDSAFNIQLYSFLGDAYSSDSVPVFALFQFVWGLTCCGAFFYSTVLSLQYQLIILVVMGSLSMTTFSKIEWEFRRTRSFVAPSGPRPHRSAEEEGLLHSHDS
ncbi:hypothetical protein RvY_12960 [Ramazzottius varieornatus]|uniref:UNC93-like protein MFSD11 n=1 Tax=Ramazzottius varieornatus TaxID=947166 RepID=A0A1D1VL93_RAMVA|nr:hypothetical protein RvY_12960 [Ramazzottius varieornatus]